MSKLLQMNCEACRRGAPKATAKEMAAFLPQIPEWRVIDRDGILTLERVFRFMNFGDAMKFTQKVGELAEDHGHHPSILTEWGKVTVSWWTHKIDGLHGNDFIMAANTDQLTR